MADNGANKEKNKRRANIFIAICIVIVIACVAYIGVYLFRQHNQADKYDKLKQKAHDTESVSTEPTETQTESKLNNPIDFKALQAENPDIYAWISIPSVQTEYPICQSATDDTYYLNYTVDGTYGLPGSIYTESLNSKDFSDFDTVIYGHHMKNGTMFGSLHKFRDAEFMKQNPNIYIYTPDCIRTYEIFAAVTYSDDHLLRTFDFTNEGDRQKYLDSIKQIRDMNSPVRDDVDVTTDSKIITLSTCIGGQPDNRLLIEAVLVDEQK